MAPQIAPAATRRAATGSPRALAAGLLLLAIGGLAVRPACAQDAPLGRLDYAPYRVAVLVTFAPDAAATPAFRSEVVSTLNARIAQSFGAVWQLVPGNTVGEDERLAPADDVGLERLNANSAGKLLEGVACDKAYFLVVRYDGMHWRVSGREWDRTVQSIGHLLTETAVERRGVGDASAALLRRLFSPILVVDDADSRSKSATLTIRAGSIPYADPQFAPLQKGSTLQAAFRFLDAKRVVKSVQTVPWTYLVVDSIEQGHAVCTVVTSFRAPLAANMRRRVEAVAILVRASFPETRLKLVRSKGDRQPLAGIFVSLQPMNAGKQAAAAPSAPPQLSDRNGSVTVTVDPKLVIRQLEVRSGSAILARRPLVVGLAADITLELPDDGLRLNAERDISLLQSQLIETVARRAALIGRVRLAAKHSDVDGVRQVLSEIDHLASASEFQSQVNKIRVLTVEDARRHKDKVAERRIDEICQKTLQLILQYLPDDRIERIKEEIADALKTIKAGAPTLPAPNPKAPDRKAPDRKAAG